MPFVDPNSTYKPSVIPITTPLWKPDVPKPQYGFLQKVDAVLGQTNLAYAAYQNPHAVGKAAMSLLDQVMPTFGRAPGSLDPGNLASPDQIIDPLADPRVKALPDLIKSGAFEGITTRTELNNTLDTIAREDQQHKIINSMGAWKYPAMMIGAATDPTNYIPVFGAGEKAYAAGKVVKTLSTVALDAGKAASGLGALTAAQDVAYQALDPTHTVGQTAGNIAGSMLLGAVVGAASRLFTKSEYNAISDGIDQQLADINKIPADQTIEAVVHRSAGAATMTDTTMAQETLVGGDKMAGAAAGLQSYLARSNSLETRRLSQMLAEDPFFRQKNLEGIPNPISLETHIKLGETEVKRVVEADNKIFAGYVKRKGVNFFKRGDASQARAEFDQLTAQAMREGDQSAVPEVQAMAHMYRGALDKIKNEAVDVGLLPADVSVSQSQSYFTRSYKIDLIQSEPKAFKQMLMDNLKFTKSEINNESEQTIVENIYNNIVQENENVFGHDNNANPSPMKERKLNVSDSALARWMDSSPRNMYLNYHKSFIPKIEQHKLFGNETFADLLKPVEDEYQAAMAKLPDHSTALSKLHTNHVKNLARLKTLYANIMGLAPKPGKVDTGGKVLRQLAHMAMLGGVAIASVPDAARLLIVDGLRPIASITKNLVFNSEFRKMIIAEKRNLAAPMEIMDQARVRGITGLDGQLMGDRAGNWAMRTLDGSVSRFTKLTGLPYWNSFMKTTAGILQENLILKAARGTVSKTQMARLAKFGLDRNDLKIISEQYAKHGHSQNSVHYANFDKWDESAFAHRVKLQSAIRKSADETIVSINAGTMPRFMGADSKLLPLYKMLLQYKSFLFASHNQLLIAGLQQHDLNFMMMIIGSVGLGMLSQMGSDAVAGRPMKKSFKALLLDGIDRSGTIPFIFMGNNALDKISNGRFSMNAWARTGRPPRYLSRTTTGALLGPAADMVFSGGAVGWDAINGRFKQRDMHKLRMLMPFNNMFYLRQLFDRVEHSTNTMFGVSKH